jgi:hypothetical protein
MTGSVGAETPYTQSTQSGGTPDDHECPDDRERCGPLPATMLSLQLPQKNLRTDQVVVEDLTSRV